MNQNHITIAIDAMGGDNSPTKVIKGCEIFLNDNLRYFWIFNLKYFKKSDAATLW